MPVFTIETEYNLPVYRQQNYEADTLEEACRLALADDEWGLAKMNYDGCGPTFVSGAWAGADNAYGSGALPVPEGFGEELARPDQPEKV